MTNLEKIQTGTEEDVVRILLTCDWCNSSCAYNSMFSCEACIRKYLNSEYREEVKSE
jgi:hypothetical protein